MMDDESAIDRGLRLFGAFVMTTLVILLVCGIPVLLIGLISMVDDGKWGFQVPEPTSPARVSIEVVNGQAEFDGYIKIESR